MRLVKDANRATAKKQSFMVIVVLRGLIRRAPLARTRVDDGLDRSDEV